MNRLDISDWKEFKIAELFDINPTRYHKLINKDLFDEEGKNPVVVNSSYNNGIGVIVTMSVQNKAILSHLAIQQQPIVFFINPMILSDIPMFKS